MIKFFFKKKVKKKLKKKFLHILLFLYSYEHVVIFHPSFLGRRYNYVRIMSKSGQKGQERSKGVKNHLQQQH